jgi:hypothetical protein
VAVVFDVPVPVTPPAQSKPVAPEGKVAEKVIPAPAHFGPFCVGALGAVGMAVITPLVLLEYPL